MKEELHMAAINSYGLTVEQIKALTIEVLQSLPICSGSDVNDAIESIKEMQSADMPPKVQIKWH